VADVGFGKDEAVLDFDRLADVAVVADAGVSADVTIRTDLAVRSDDHVALDENAGQDARALAELNDTLDHRGGMDFAFDPVFTQL
jgi:hypothetical protein